MFALYFGFQQFSLSFCYSRIDPEVPSELAAKSENGNIAIEAS